MLPVPAPEGRNQAWINKKLGSEMFWIVIYV
jgi:hypothetical protein